MNDMIIAVNRRLEELISRYKDGPVKEAMLYSLMAGGKRLRPIIFLTTLRSYGYSFYDYLDIACAIEMIHTYSLIHDDLPAMDDDDLRRGQPTCHKKYGEAVAILAGDALLNEAGFIVLSASLDASLKVSLLKALLQASGANGMIYGQQQDMYLENKDASLEEITDMEHHKTGCMIAVSFALAGLIAAPEDVEKLTQLGYDLGLAFQIQDDILDLISDTETLGKPVGSDLKNDKNTYVSLLGLDASKEQADALFHSCLEHIYGLQLNHGLMIDLLNLVIKRVN